VRHRCDACPVAADTAGARPPDALESPVGADDPLGQFQFHGITGIQSAEQLVLELDERLRILPLQHHLLAEDAMGNGIGRGALFALGRPGTSRFAGVASVGRQFRAETVDTASDMMFLLGRQKS